FRIAQPDAPLAYTISTVAGQSVITEGGQATVQPLPLVTDVARDNLGNLYIASLYTHKVYEVAPNGVLTTFAGTGTSGPGGDGGPATAAQLSFPRSVVVDENRNVYIADSGNLRVRKVSPDGTMTTFAGTGGFGF